MRTMMVVLEIDVEDLPEALRQEIADGMQEPVATLPKLAETELGCIANVLEFVGSEGATELAFEGTDTYVRFTRSDVKAYWWKDGEA